MDETAGSGKGASSLRGRRLCPTERGFWKFDQAASANAVVSARIRGSLTDAALREALAALQARHPYFQARIEVDDRGQPFFHFGDVGPLPLRVVHRPADEWVDAFEEELNEKVPWQEGPLARCALVRHSGEELTLLLAIHHAVSDGNSGALAMRDLVQACRRTMLGASPGLVPLDDIRSVEARLPARLWSLLGLRVTGEFVAEEVRLRAKAGAPFKVPRAREAPFHARRVRCLPRALDAAKTAKLAARAREEGTSVYGALSAAMLLGALEATGATRPRHMSLGSPVNLRKVLVPPVGDDVGDYASMVAYREVVSPDASFWALARSVRGQVARRLERGDAPLMLDFFEGIFRLLGGPAATPIEIAERWEKQVVSSMVMSNMGRLDLGLDAGPLSVEAMHICGALSVLGDFGAVTTTFEETLRWMFVWIDPLIGSSTAERLVSAITGRLEQAMAD